MTPPSALLLSALARHKLLVGLCALTLAVAGAAYGATRQPTYTASATLQVGQVNPNSPGFYSYVSSASALATAFSRAIGAAPVLATVQKRLGISPLDAASQLSAEPLPESPAFRIVATAASEHKAVALANVTAAGVISYEARSNSANPQATSLLNEYREASIELQRADGAVAAVERNGHSHHGTTTGSGALATMIAERETAMTRLTALGDAYTAAVTSEAPRAGLVTLLAGATTASSGRAGGIELLTLVGLVVGGLLGCALAVWRERPREQAEPHAQRPASGSSAGGR